MLQENSFSRQIEKVLDEDFSSERTADIIIHFRARSKALPAAMNASAETVRNRRLVTHYSDLLPPPRSELVEGSIESESSDYRTSQIRGLSFARNMRTRIDQSSSIDIVKQKSTGRIKGLMENSNLRGAVLRSSEVPEIQGFPASRPIIFWSSEALRIVIEKDELASLIKDEALETQVSKVFPNRKIGLPRYLPSSRTFKTDGQLGVSSWGVERIGALSAWGAFGKKGEGTKIAVLDTGVSVSHPSLINKVKGWAEFDSAGNLVRGSTPRDTDVHGTHVCGTICGGDETGRFIGVAPESEIYAALVLNGETGGSTAQVLAALDWAIEQEVDVINLSLGGLTLERVIDSPFHRTFFNAARAGIAVVAAVGNDGGQTSGVPGNDFFAFSVGAVDITDRCAAFSGGRTHLVEKSDYIDKQLLPLAYSKPDICAPGVEIVSACTDTEDRLASLSGTSMATPHVAGAIALLLSACPGLKTLPGFQRSSVIQDIILATCTDLGERGPDHRFGLGRVDVLKAIDEAVHLGYG